MAKVFYADDEIKYRRLIDLFLKNQGHEVTCFENGEDLLEAFSNKPCVDLVILDIMMPILNGIETCKILREMSSVPILMLTALGDIKSEVQGLDVGADDYISKPFSNEKLIARVSALLRRNMIKEKEVLSVDCMSFDEEKSMVIISDVDYALTQKEYDLLKVLVINKNQLVLRDTLLNKVWGYTYEGDPRTLDTHIKSLRSKIGVSGDQIKTSRGKGYYYRSKSWKIYL